MKGFELEENGELALYYIAISDELLYNKVIIDAFYRSGRLFTTFFLPMRGYTADVFPPRG